MGEVTSTLKPEREFESERRNHWKILLLILAFAFGLRVFLGLFPGVIQNDGIEYIRHAKQVLAGNWTGGKSAPLYPGFIGAGYIVIKDFELAGIWVSVIFGALLVIPVFYLGKEIFNETVGIVSALFAAVHPFLYVSAGSVLTESTYYFLLGTSVLFGWYAFKEARFSHIVLFSFFTTLAYFTKPEAIGILIVFSVWTLSMNPPNGERRFVKRIGIILIASISFLIFSFPYLQQIRNEKGTWGISKKATISIGSLSEEEEAPSLETLRKKKGITLSSLIKHPLPVLGKIGTGIVVSLYRFLHSYNPILFFLAVFGWVLLSKKESVYSWKGNFFLLAHLIFYFGFVFPFFIISKRYTSQMVSISIPWAAFGFLELTEWLHRRWRGGIPLKKFSILLLIFLLAGLFIQGGIKHIRKDRTIQKEAGLWMKENLPRGIRIMSRLPQEAFYGETGWARIPKGNYEEVLGVARFKGIQYLVLDEGIEKEWPGFWKQIKERDLILLKDLKMQDRRMAIFKIIY